MYFAPLNSPRLDSPTVFALATDQVALKQLHRAYPDRTFYSIALDEDRYVAIPE
jgi:hypothetical protein